MAKVLLDDKTVLEVVNCLAYLLKREEIRLVDLQKTPHPTLPRFAQKCSIAAAERRITEIKEAQLKLMVTLGPTIDDQTRFKEVTIRWK